MAKLRILKRNIADTAALYGAPAFATENPITILQQQTERGVTARTSSLAAQDILAYWTSDQKARMVAFTRHNLTTAATLRTRLYAGGSPSSLLYDGGALTAFSLAGLDTDLDVPTESDFRGYKTSVQYFSQQTTVQQAILSLADAANPDGYMEAIRLFIGDYLAFAYDPVQRAGGVALNLMDAGVAERADDGTHVVDKRWKARQVSLECRFIQDNDLAAMLALARYLGKDKETFISVYPEVGGVYETYHHFACRLVESPTFSRWSEAVLHGARFVFEET